MMKTKQVNEYNVQPVFFLYDVVAMDENIMREYAAKYYDPFETYGKGYVVINEELEYVIKRDGLVILEGECRVFMDEVTACEYADKLNTLGVLGLLG